MSTSSSHIVADRAQRQGHRQRLRQRFLKDMGTSMPDYELLELLLTQAIPRRDTKPLAKALIARFGDFAGVVSAPPEDLLKVEGMGEVVLTTLKLVQSAALRLLRQEAQKQPDLSSYDKVVGYCQAAMSRETVEQFRTLFLNSQNCLIADEVVQRGTVSHAPVYPREVAKRALELGAAAVIMVHNHPSGSPEPSQADLDITTAVHKACAVLDIALHDHLIVGRHGAVSLRARGWG